MSETNETTPSQSQTLSQSPTPSAAETATAPVPLLQLLQLPGLPEGDGEAPVCGPDGCAVPGAGTR